MIYINEWFPNPRGAEGGAEFVELYNSGPTERSLAGWKLSDGKKIAALDARSVPAFGYLILRKSDTKLALKNTSGTLLLYGPGGKVADEGSFLGSAPEGRSFSRVDYSAAPIQHFAFATPTPGRQNAAAAPLIADRVYPLETRLNAKAGPAVFWSSLLSLALLLPLLFLYVIKKNENLQKFFLERDRSHRRKDG